MHLRIADYFASEHRSPNGLQNQCRALAVRGWFDSIALPPVRKVAIYAAAGVSQYLIVNFPGDRTETFGDPDAGSARWASVRSAYRGERIELSALPGLSLSVEELLPRL